MSGFTIRRFALQNIAAVATHCPIPGVSQAALKITYGPAAVQAAAHAATTSINGTEEKKKKTSDCGQKLTGRLLSMLVGTSSSSGKGGERAKSTFSLVTEEEMLWIQQRRREDANESRIVLATRPTRNLLKGIGGGLLNLTLGCLLSPLIFLSITLEKIRTSSSIGLGLVAGPIYGGAWAAVFLGTACYAALQQTVSSFYYSCAATPAHYLLNRPSSSSPSTPARACIWSPLHCRFVAPRGRKGESDPMLFCFDEDSVLRERAMQRLAVRKKKDRSETAYVRRKTKPGQQAREDDYYGLLGVDKSATEREIKMAYNKLVLEIHPDKSPAPGAADHFDKVTKAYRVLSNPAKRKKFDLGGAKGVEDLGAQKREGVRALFGGETLVKLSGDVFLGSFSQRVMDGLDHTQEELAVMQQRMYESCRDELLEGYLSHFIDWVDPSESSSGSSSSTAGGMRSSKPSLSSSTSTSASSSSAVASLSAWDGKMKSHLKKIVSTGLAKEVLYVLGQEYKRVVAYYRASLNKADVAAPSSSDSAGKDGKQSPSASSVARACTAPAPLATLVSRRLRLYLTEVGPHNVQQRKRKYKCFARVRSDTFKSSESMVDLAWYSSVKELERTARAVALAILFDPSLPSNEVARRVLALDALADVFIHYGQVYKGANKQTMDQLMNSLRDYQHQRQRAKEENGK